MNLTSFFCHCFLPGCFSVALALQSTDCSDFKVGFSLVFTVLYSPWPPPPPPHPKKKQTKILELRYYRVGDSWCVLLIFVLCVFFSLFFFFPPPPPPPEKKMPLFSHFIWHCTTSWVLKGSVSYSYSHCTWFHLDFHQLTINFHYYADNGVMCAYKTSRLQPAHDSEKTAPQIKK